MKITSDMLLEYLDDQLSAEQRRQVEQALLHDRRLQAELNELKQLRALLRSTFAAVERIPVHPRAVTFKQRSTTRVLALTALVGCMVVLLALGWQSVRPLQQANTPIVPATQPTTTILHQETQPFLAESAKQNVVGVIETNTNPPRFQIQPYGANGFEVNQTIIDAAVNDQQQIFRVEQTAEQPVLVQSDLAGVEAWRVPLPAAKTIQIAAQHRGDVAVFLREDQHIRWMVFDQTGTLQISNVSTTNVCSDFPAQVTNDAQRSTLVCYHPVDHDCLRKYELAIEPLPLMCNLGSNSTVYQFSRVHNTVTRVSSMSTYVVSHNTIMRIGAKIMDSNDAFLGAQPIIGLPLDYVNPAYITFTPDQTTALYAEQNGTSTTIMTYRSQTNGQFTRTNQMPYPHTLQPFSMQFNREGTLAYGLAASRTSGVYDTIVEFTPDADQARGEYTEPAYIIRKLLLVM